MNGLWRCAKYAFSPNKLKYCGPDKNQELAGYLKTKTSDLGLKEMLNDFRAMQPYLKLIANENGIKDEFDEQAVEAYWLGNELLDTITLKSFFNHVRPQLAKNDLKWFEFKLPLGAKPHHSFHVFNFFKRAGHRAVPHTVETMDQCRISVGKVMSKLTVITDQLVFRSGKLKLEPVVKKVQSLDNDLKPGDLVTIHWNCVCEKVTQQQAKNLEKYTRLALRLANLTV